MDFDLIIDLTESGQCRRLVVYYQFHSSMLPHLAQLALTASVYAIYMSKVFPK